MLRKRADERTRTADLLITSELLYQLSYVGLLRCVSISQRVPAFTRWRAAVRGALPVGSSPYCATSGSAASPASRARHFGRRRRLPAWRRRASAGDPRRAHCGWSRPRCRRPRRPSGSLQGSRRASRIVVGPARCCPDFGCDPIITRVSTFGKGGKSVRAFAQPLKSG